MTARKNSLTNCMLNASSILSDLKGLYGKKLLVAFSGGKDSVALLHYVWKHQNQGGWAVAACHVNHNLRGDESDRDEIFCRDWCAERRVEFVCVRADVREDNSADTRGVEHAARVIRYKLLETERKRLGFDYILTGHTADDQLESFFVDLFTGASIYTLGGVNETQGQIIRPFLNVTSEMVYEYLETEGLDHIYDSSNSELRFVRNMVRAEFLPLLRKYGEIGKTIRRLQQESRLLNGFFAEKTESVAIFEDNSVIMRRDLFDKLSTAEKCYVLGRWLSVLCRGGYVHTLAVMEQLGKKKSARLSLPEQHVCEVTPVSVRIFHKKKITPFGVLKKSGERDVCLPNGRRIKFTGNLANKILFLRSRIDGDRFRGKKLKDIFNSRRVELYNRDRAVVAVEDGNIIWVEYICGYTEIFVD